MIRRRPKTWPELMKAECRIAPDDEEELIREAVMWKVSPAAKRWLFIQMEAPSPEELAQYDRGASGMDGLVDKVIAETGGQAEIDERLAAFEAWFAADPERAAEIMRRVEQLEQAAREGSA